MMFISVYILCSSDYRCSNQTLVTIVGTLVRFEVRLNHAV